MVADFKTELGLTFCRVQTVLNVANVVHGVQKPIAEQSVCIIKHTIAQLPYNFAALSFHYYVHRYLMMTNIIIVPVLAFTWIISLYAVGGQEKIYAILFVLANVLQV